MIGWSIATNGISLEPIILFLIIFIWTPSHFWALSLYKKEEYNNANIPMLPVVSGIKTTKINIYVYALVLFLISLAPVFLGFFSIIYFFLSLFLGSYYVYLCYKLLKEHNPKKEKRIAKRIFVYSIFYLFLIFLIILLDNLIRII